MVMQPKVEEGRISPMSGIQRSLQSSSKVVHCNWLCYYQRARRCRLVQRGRSNNGVKLNTTMPWSSAAPAMSVEQEKETAQPMMHLHPPSIPLTCPSVRVQPLDSPGVLSNRLNCKWNARFKWKSSPQSTGLPA